MNLNNISKYRSQIYGLSIIFIMLYHAKNCGYLYSGIADIFNWGNMGVDVFLFMSGICLHYSLEKDKRMGAYFWKRLIRIIVPVVIIVSAYWIYHLTDGVLGLKDLTSRYLLLDFWLTGNRQIWYVSMLLVAYILYPFIHEIIYNRESLIWRYASTIVIILVFTCIALAIRHELPDYYDKVEVALTRFPIFIAGCGIAEDVGNSRRLPVWTAVPMLGASALFVVLILRNPENLMLERFLYSAIAIMLTILIASLLGLIDQKAINSVLGFFGIMSLELYLMHVTLTRFYCESVIVPFMGPVLGPYLLLLLISVIISYPISLLNAFIAGKLKRVII